MHTTVNTLTPEPLALHQRLNFGNFNGCAAGDEFAALRGDDRIVFNPNADIPEALRDVFGGPDIQAWLDGEDHIFS